MPTNNSNPAPGDETPNGANQTPETGNNQPTQTPDETSESTTTFTSLEAAAKEVEKLKAALKNANRESASHRHKAKELDDLKSQIENEKLTEQERLQKELDQVKSTLSEKEKAYQTRLVNAEVRAKASQLGIVDPDAAAKLLNWTDIQYDDSGEPNNLDALLKDLVKNKPYLGAKHVPTSGGATNPSRSSTVGNNELSWDAISKMTQADYMDRRTEIQRWMAANPKPRR